MSMPTLNRRLQVLIDDERYGRLERRASDEGISVGEFVRRAIDSEMLRTDRTNKQKQLLEYIKNAPRIDISPDELDRLIDESHMSREYWAEGGDSA